MEIWCWEGLDCGGGSRGGCSRGGGGGCLGHSLDMLCHVQAKQDFVQISNAIILLKSMWQG